MFQTIPDNFFVPLSSPNKIVYWECICKLFSVMEHQLSFGVEREVLVDELQYYFERAAAAELKDEEFAGADSRDKANGILRRLEYYGWIEIETDRSYIQRVNFQEYAVRLMKTFLEVAEGRQIEYQGYIYTIYSLVQGYTDHPGIVLLQIFANTDLLITGLKNLNSNIKHYIDELTRHSTVAQIMDVLFNDYMENIVDKAYHRLLTSDNVSKFRPEIIETLERQSRQPEYLEKAASEVAILKDMTKDEAREAVYKYLHEIIEAFRNMDDILEEINRKNTQYQRAAINRARFLLSGDEDVRGQIKEILVGINEEIQQKDLDTGGIYEVEFLEGLVRLYSCSVLDENSLYSPTEGQKEFLPQELSQETENPEERQEKLRKMMEKMQRVLSAERVEGFIDEKLGVRGEMNASELPLNSTEDFVRIIYVRLYGQRKNMNYKVEMQEDCRVNGYKFKDFIIRRK